MGTQSRINPVAGAFRINPNPAEVCDAFGRVLQVGDVIYVQTGAPTGWRVEAIERVVEHGVPDGLMEIVIGARMTFRTGRQQPNTEFVRILTRAEIGTLQGAAGMPPAPPLEAVQDDGEIRNEDPDLHGLDADLLALEPPLDRPQS